MLKSLSEAMKLPDDMTPGLPFFKIEGDSQIALYGKNNILDYSENEIKISMKGLQITIGGSSLCINYIDDDAVLIKGSLEAVLFKKVI